MVVGRHRSAGAKEAGGLDVVSALRHGRRVARLSQRDLARRAEVSQSLIARIEARRVDPPVGLMQRLLGLCGLRWDLSPTSCGATPARAATCTNNVRESARRRKDAAAGERRAQENAAARSAAAAVGDSWLTVRERRAHIRQSRLAERARQAAATEAFIRSDDAAMAGWLQKDLRACERLLRQRREQLAVPLARRLSEDLAGRAADDAQHLLEALSSWYFMPPVMLVGRSARAVWSPRPARGTPKPLELAALRGRDWASAFLSEVGAHALPAADSFALGAITVRLTRSPPPSAVLLRWAPGWPTGAIAVARPEALPGALIDRHARRAVLELAGRDSRGRRFPPYHEAVGVAVSPKWFEPA